MHVLSRLKNNVVVLCDTEPTALDIPVQGGLSLTPRRIQELTSKGIAVSSSDAEPVYDSPVSFSDYSIDPIYERGMDRNTLWERSMLAKQRILSSKDKLTVVERQKKQEEA